MDELPAAGVDADVVLLPAGLEEDQIAVLQPVTIDRSAQVGLGFGGPRQIETHHLLVGELGEGGAVETGPIRAAHAIGNAAPLLIKAFKGAALLARWGWLGRAGTGGQQQGQQG